MGVFANGGFWLIVALEGSEDETETRAAWNGRTAYQRHPPRDAQTVLGGREDPHCSGRKQGRFAEAEPLYKRALVNRLGFGIVPLHAVTTSKLEQLYLKLEVGSIARQDVLRAQRYVAYWLRSEVR